MKRWAQNFLLSEFLPQELSSTQRIVLTSSLADQRRVSIFMGASSAFLVVFYNDSLLFGANGTGKNWAKYLESMPSFAFQQSQKKTKMTRVFFSEIITLKVLSRS